MAQYRITSKEERRRKMEGLTYRSLSRRFGEFVGRFIPRRRKEVEYRSPYGKQDVDPTQDTVIIEAPPERNAFTTRQCQVEGDRSQYAREMPVPQEAGNRASEKRKPRQTVPTRRSILGALAGFGAGVSCIGAGMAWGYLLSERKHKRMAQGVAATNSLEATVEPNGIHENGVRPINQEGRNISTKEDIQSLLGLAVDGDIGPQTKYALETLLLDIERQGGQKFKKVNYADIGDEVYALLNRVNDRDIDVRVTNVEAVAHRHFGSYIMEKEYLKVHSDTIQTEDQAFEFFGIKNKRKKQLREELLAFKTIMNYKHGISMPINTKLDDTAYIAINYAKAVGLDMKVKDFSHSKLKVNANGKNYEFLIPSFGMSIMGYQDVLGVMDAVDPHDPIIRMVANEVTRGLSTREGEAKHLLNFVQDPDYSYDVGGGDFAKHPLKTLTERTGDCEDSTVLYLSLLRARGIECGYVSIEDSRPDHYNHAMAAVMGRFSGDGFKMSDGFYYLSETTNPNREIGDHQYKGVPEGKIEWKLTVI